MDEEHRPKYVNADSYLQMLKEEVWLEVRSRATRQQLCFQQDGASCHCTDEVLDFLHSKFHDRVISRRSEFAWPPYSPDLNPLDYFFWGYAMAEAFHQKPATLDELKEVVEDLAAELSGEILGAVMENFRIRCQACMDASGGAFEYFL